eukprot:CAMPEP_0201552366 /NCGR_PEP_ID=MMETSP0173_2-20130828/15390_1 /ASSEMBLY_ACC=CAM_ASM_000268 /TAXON_ID=218659 /ORGANISM="Vexillifera sp., Strain DIVA3 564/2" /LENGTH=140 /DNA_ID=CAMNT_0047962839 /DNA_START=243 /DNA_END=665 /DNA_ORIENTATION=+
MLSPTKLSVNNACRRDSLDAKWTGVEGFATVLDPSVPGKLKVEFPIGGIDASGPYDIIILDEKDYKYAVIWSCQNVFGSGVYQTWILYRNQSMPQSLYEGLMKKASQITGVDYPSVMFRDYQDAEKCAPYPITTATVPVS